jgi:tetratricopeptide (TPR) repeat protein
MINSLWYRLGADLSRIGGLALVILLLPVLGATAATPSFAPQGATAANFFLKEFRFTTVPLAESLTAKTPRVRQDEGELPDWKRRWDEARRLVVAGNLARAVDLYHDLLAEKEIAEARWELATVLVALGRDMEASDEVEALHDEAPDNPKYLQCLAVINLHLGRFQPAAAAFERLHVLGPNDDNALAGAVYALMAANDNNAALPLLQKLWGRRPTSVGLREALASLAYETHEYEVAWPHLVELAKSPKATAQVLLMAAKVGDSLQRPELALGFWQRYVLVRPDDLEARQVLADSLEKGGQLQQALPQLLEIHQLRPDDLPVLKRIGQGYMALQDFARAVGPLSEYVTRSPNDREAVEALVKAQVALGRKAETLQAMERYLSVEPHPDRVILEKAARLYEETGAHAEAERLWQRLRVMRPDDPTVLRALAKQLLTLGHEKEALTVWQQLARLVPGEIGIYRSMAEVLEHLGRQQELYDTLALIHKLDPADQDLSLKLVSHYVAEDDLQRAKAIISSMEQSAIDKGVPLPASLSYWRGMILIKQHEYAAAQKELEVFLVREPKSEAVQRQALVVAGRLGDVARVRAHVQVLTSRGEVLPPDLQLVVAQAYADCRAEDEARAEFRKIIDGAAGITAQKPDAVLPQAFKGLSDSFIRDERPYEAEEALRTGLVVTQDRRLFLPLLFSQALAQNQVEEAKAWLAGLRPLLPEASRQATLMEAALLIAQGELRQARRDLSRVDEALGQEVSAVEPNARAGTADRLELAGLWLKAGKAAPAAKQAGLVLKGDPTNLEAKVILAKSGDASAQGVGRIELASLHYDQLCDLSELYRRYGLLKKMAKAAQQALIVTPGSPLRAGLLLEESLVAKGELAKACDQLNRLEADHPREFSLKVRRAKLLFLRGETASVEGLVNSPAAKARPELILMHARLLWRQNRWDEAIAVYRNFLTPRVAVSLRRASEESRTVLPAIKRKRSIWEIVTRDPGPDPEDVFADQVMAPATFLSFLDHKESRFAYAAARLVGLYRWQAQFAMELAPRQSVVRREYTIAQKQYEAFLARYPHERIVLYDLAGMYSRLGSLGQEAAAYDKLNAAGVEFPELDEARTRNLLKQRPRTSLIAGYQTEGGRNGYLDRTKEWEGLSAWDSFSTQHEAEMTAERLNYHAGNREDIVRATRAVATYSAGLASGLTVKGGGGIFSSDRGDGNTLLADAAVVGKIGDGLTGTMAFDRDVVDDTTASLRRQLVRQDLLGSLSLDPLPRLSVGGDYLVRDYSDNNWTTGYTLWSSYLLFAEPTFLQLKYSYDFKDSREGASPGTPTADGFGVDDHPYWAPKNYWVNQLGLYFKHSLARDSFDRGVPRYYSLEYDLGHDVDGYAVQTVKASLYAEFNSHYLVEAGSEVVTSQAVRKQEYRLNAIYRW